MKLLLPILLLLSGYALGCTIEPEGLVEQHLEQSKLYFFIAMTGLLIALAMRFFSNRKRIWVPLLFISFFTYIPAYMVHMELAYSGMCGIPGIVSAAQVLAIGAGALLSYEAIILFRSKLSIRHQT